MELEIKLVESQNNSKIEFVVEKIFAENGLVCSLKGSLKSYPDSIHWHFKKNKEKGTLEITYWNKAPRLWIKVAKNRRGDWMDSQISVIKCQLEESLSEVL